MTTVVIDDKELVSIVYERFGKRSTDWIKSVERDGQDITIRFHGGDVPIEGSRVVTVCATDLLKAWQLFLRTDRWDNHVSDDLSGLTQYGAELLLLQASLELFREGQWQSNTPSIELQLASGTI